jgi:hypothetical protein
MSMIGLRVGPFEIVEPARIPGPRRFYVARRTGMTRRQPAEVLVQLVEPDAPPEQRAALQRSFEVMKGLDDPRIPTAVGFYEGLGALATTHPGGAPLRVLVEARADDSIPMTPSTLLDVLLELAESLQRAHHRGAAHGHLGPDTVFLAPDGAVWMLGWGQPDQRAPAPWLPPEHARGQGSTPATDQWSLAALATALITGRSPWPAEHALAAARAGDPSEIVGPVQRQWPALARLLRRMLDPHPANRFDSMHPVRQEMLGLARKAGGTSDRREIAAELATRWATAPLPTAVAHEPEPQPGPQPEPELGPPTEETELFEALPQDHLATQRFAPVVEPEDTTADRLPVPVAPPVVEEEPTADRTESIGALLDRIGAQQADVEPSEETVRFADASQLLAPEPDSDETVRFPAAAIRQALEEDAVLVDGGAPTAVPATDSAEPHTDPGVSHAATPAPLRMPAPTPAAKPRSFPPPRPPSSRSSEPGTDLTTGQRVLIGGLLVIVIVLLIVGVATLA